MSGEVQLLIAITIASVLILSVVFIRKGIYPRVMRVFLVLFVIGQAAGYGIGVDFMKILIPRGETGTSYSVASTAIPLALAFGIDLLRRRSRNACTQSRAEDL